MTEPKNEGDGNRLSPAQSSPQMLAQKSRIERLGTYALVCSLGWISFQIIFIAIWLLPWRAPLIIALIKLFGLASVLAGIAGFLMGLVSAATKPGALALLFSVLSIALFQVVIYVIFAGYSDM